MNIAQFLTIFISAVFIYNVILSRFLGLCSFVAISKETRPALAMSLAVMFVTTMSSLITWFIYRFLLIPFHITYLRTISFINGRPVPGSFYYSVFQGICVGLGYALAMLLMSGIRERLDLCDVPKAVKDFPLSFVIAALMSLSFMGF